MRIFRYWAKAELPGKHREGFAVRLVKWGGSNESLAAAQEAAKAAVSKLRDNILNSGFTGPWGYGYDRDLREEIVETIDENNVISRNRYGCLILNSTNLMFADIDFIKRGFIARLFGYKEVSEASALAQLKAWLAARPAVGVRVYRTAAGLRYAFVSALSSPNETAQGVLKELGSDRLYTLLCQQQKCFRARLTPKPWRAKIERPTWRYPFEASGAEDVFRRWLGVYESGCRNFATVDLVGDFGAAGMHEMLGPVLAAHDRLCKVGSKLPLA